MIIMAEKRYRFKNRAIPKCKKLLLLGHSRILALLMDNYNITRNIRSKKAVAYSNPV